MGRLNEAWWLLFAVGAAAHVESSTSCTCDCCGVRRAQSWEHGEQCASVAELDRPSDQCPETCTNLVNASGSTPVEYPRFCFDACQPASMELATACVLRASLDAPTEVDPVEPMPVAVEAQPGQPPVPGRAPRETGKVPSTPAAPLALVRRQAREAEPSPAALQLAKAAYLEAKVHAKAAGAAARRAKESYELTMRSAREMSEFAGRMIYDEVQREAGEESRKAMEIRIKYQNDAQAAAIKTAEATAAPYKAAAKTAAGTALMWNLRANEFATSAQQLKDQAAATGEDAQKYINTQDYSDAEDYIRQSHQLVEQSQAMSGRAEAAHATANQIQGTLNWYAIAGRGAAAKMMANAMPYDVPPPALPNTVFLQKQMFKAPREGAIGA